MKYDLTSNSKTSPQAYMTGRIPVFSGIAGSMIFAAAVFSSLSLQAHAQVFWGPDSDYGADRRFEPQSFQRGPLERPHRYVARKKHRQDAEPFVKEASKPQGPVVIAISIDEQRLRIYDSNGLFAETPVSTGMRGHSTPMGVFSVIGKEKYHRSNIYSGAPMPYMQRITWSGVAMHAGVLPGYPASHGCVRMPMNFAIRMYGWTKQGARVVIAPGVLSPTDISHPLLFTHKPDLAPVEAVAPDNTGQRDNVVSTSKSDSANAAAATITTTADAGRPELRPAQISPSSEQIQTADASGAVPQKINDAQAKATDVTSEAKAETTGIDEAKDTPKQPANTEPKTDKDQTRQIAADKPADPPSAAKDDTAKAASKAARASGKAAVAEQPKTRTGHIAAYISRKESKLFVRQNFEPLFEAPVEIADRDRPLGTHVFTIRADKDDPKTYRWSVISLPARASMESASRRKKGQAVAQAPTMTPSSPTEALDRLKIPDQAMQRIAEAIAPGGSIMVSDQGLGDETGLGTDFIVPLR